MYKFDMEIKDEVKYKYKVSRIFFFFNPNFNHIPAFFISPPLRSVQILVFLIIFSFLFLFKIGVKKRLFFNGTVQKMTTFVFYVSKRVFIPW
jgi:hypothetical protein